MANIILQIKARHFENADFWQRSSCSISKAYTELTGNECLAHINETYDVFTGVSYKHKFYTESKFIEDHVKAKSHNFDNTVIREIEMNESVENIILT